LDGYSHFGWKAEKSGLSPYWEGLYLVVLQQYKSIEAENVIEAPLAAVFPAVIFMPMSE
jgi:hypothetical protein